MSIDLQRLQGEFDIRARTCVLLKGGRILNPYSGTDFIGDVLIDSGYILNIAPHIKTPHLMTQVFDCQNLWIAPGLIDLHVHLREPGFEHKETIETGARAAVCSGFTTIVAMPNTNPVIDSQAMVHYIRSRAKQAKQCRVLTTAAITEGQKGLQLTPMHALYEAGCVGFTDDGKPVSNAALMRRALEYAKPLGIPIISHAEDIDLSAQGHMHEGFHACCLGIIGIPHAAEEVCVARDIILTRLTRGQLHLAHLSCKNSIHMVRQAKQEGLKVTCEVTPHHFSLTDTFVRQFDTHAKMNPPLRLQEDVDAILEGLKDGTVDAIATDHAPHAALEKEQSFDQAPFGIIGLETALPLTLALVRRNVLTPLQCIEKLSYNPARILGLSAHLGALKIGALADITVIDPNLKKTLTQKDIYSRSHNTPFMAQTLQGFARMTMVAGEIVYAHMNQEDAPLR